MASNPSQQERYDSILQAAQFQKGRGAPPVERWDPEYCGELDMRIARDGTWFYMGSPIGRLPLVKLFSSVLRREPDGSYVLVTPVEKVGIVVEDVPFIGVELNRVEQDGEAALALRTNVDDAVVISDAHPLTFQKHGVNDGLEPYCLIRSALQARLARPLLYQLADMGEEHQQNGTDWFGVTSCGTFFPMMRMSELEAALSEPAQVDG